MIEEKVLYKWYQIQDLVFTAPKYLKEFLVSVLGPDEHRDIIWINNQSPHLYETRWRPDFVFIYIAQSQTDNLDIELRRSKIGYIACTQKAVFQTFDIKHIQSLIDSPYIEELIGQQVLIVRGPLEDFKGKVVEYSTEKRQYVVEVPLLRTSVRKFLHVNEFCLDGNN